MYVVFSCMTDVYMFCTLMRVTVVTKYAVAISPKYSAAIVLLL